MRAPSLSVRLLLVASAALLPLAIVCGFALNGLLQAQRTQTQTSTLGVARALATSVDSELKLTISALQALSLAEPLGAHEDSGLLDALVLAKSLRTAHPEWRGVLLVAPSGKVVFSTEGTVAGPGGEVVEPASLAEVVRTRQPGIGVLTTGPRGNTAFAVRVPVVRDDAVRYVLTAIVRPDAIAAVLARQRVPEGWAFSVFDSALTRVARSREDERFRGRPPSDSLRELLVSMGDRREYVGTTRNIDGTEVQAAVAKLDVAPWIVALGAPTAVADDALRRTLIAYGGGLLVSLLVGGLAAWWMARSITQPIGRLRRSADALGQGLPLNGASSGILEIDAVAHALADAAVQRTEHEAERDSLLHAERSARTVAQAAQTRLERLVDASAVLSRSLEEESTLQAIAGIIVPHVADLCRIDLLNEDEVLERKLTHHADPARSAEVAQIVDGSGAPTTGPGSFPWAVATGQTFIRNLDRPEELDELDPQLAVFARRLGITAGCVVPLVARGRTIGAMAILQDRSKRRFSSADGALIGELAQRAALALDNVRLLARARKAQTQAEVASQAKDEFLAMLGHELRNPLAPISLALTLVGRKDPHAFPREREIIERQVRHLSRLVDDLLDISRIVAGKIVLRPEQVDLRDVAAKAIELTLPALQTRSRMPRLSLPAEPVRVLGDPLRLAQIVSNLLNNAAKFTQPDDGIALSLTVEGGQAALSVSDEGMGIAPELLPQVFDRFVQGAQHLQRASGGLGLGLAIAQSLARLHGGVIEAHSDGPGHGSRFTVRLPLAGEAPVQVDLQPDAATAGVPALRLLLVDDNRDALDVLAEWFAIEGHEVTTAGSAEEALTLLEARTPDAGIFDIGLPGMSGHELARRVRAIEQAHAAGARRMALIALTGYGQESDRRKAIEAGFDAHFPKPADLAKLQEALRQLLGGTRAGVSPGAAAAEAT